MTPLPIGIAGHDGCGKTMLGRLIFQAFGESGASVEFVSLARALRYEVEEMKFRDPWEKPTPDHMRALLRAWGWARRAEEGEDYWLNLALESILPANKRGWVTVTDDVRHLNEARWFAENGLLIALHRPATDPRVTPEDPPIIREVEGAKRLAHISIKNETTPEVLASWVPMIVREAMGAREGIPFTPAHVHAPVF